MKWAVLLVLASARLAAALCGDVNGDNVVNIGDALVAAQFDVGSISCANPHGLKQPENCDVNHDLGCNIGDALRFAQCDTGIISCAFTCSACNVCVPATCMTTTTTLTTTTTTITTTSTTTTGTGPSTTTTTVITTTTTTITTTTTSTTTTTTLPPGTCSAPLTIPAAGGVFSGTTSGTSLESGSCGSTSASPELVYQWTPSITGTASANVCGAAYDTVLYVRTGTCHTGTPVACNDDFCANANQVRVASLINFGVTAGQRYFLFVDGSDGAAQGNHGAFNLTVTPPAASTTTVTTTTTTTTTATTTTTTTTTTTLTTTTVTTTSTTTTGTGPTTTTTTHTTTTVTTTSTTTTTTTTTLTTTTTSPGNVHLVGNVAFAGAGLHAVADPARNRVYITGRNFGLSIIDVTSTSAPIGLGTTIPPFSVGASGNVGFFRNTAVVTSNANPGGGLRVVDMTNPQLPVTVGFIAGSYIGGAMPSAAVAYVRVSVTGNPGHVDLGIIDLSTPSNPHIVRQDVLPSGSNTVIDGTHLFVDAGTAGLKIYDIGTTTASQLAPTLIATAAVTSNGVVVANGFAYVQSGPGIQAINVTTPSSPVLAGTVATSGQDMAIGNARLFVVNSVNLVTVSLASPGAPIIVSTVSSHNSQGVGAAGDFAYVVGPDDQSVPPPAGLYVFDAHTGTPTVVGTIPKVQGHQYVAVQGNRAMTTGSDKLLRVIDITAPTHPTITGALDVTTLPGGLTGVVGAALAPDGAVGYARVSVPGNPGHVDLGVFNLTNPTAPTLAKQVFVSQGTPIAGLGTRLYVGAGSAGFQIYDIGSTLASELSPTFLATVNVSAFSALAAAGNFVYCLSPSGMTAVNVSNPTAPVIGTTYPIGGDDLAVDSGRVYASNSVNLTILNATDPLNPTLYSTTSNPCNSQTVGAFGALAFLPDPQGGQDLCVLNVSDPVHPVLASRVTIPGNGYNVVATGTRVYLGDASAALDIFSTVP